MSENQFKIVTYNIEYGSQKEKIIENIIQLANEGVDIFCLQEVINTQDEEFFISALLHQLGDSWQGDYHVGKEAGRMSLGNAIIWNKKKFILKSVEKILLPVIKKFDLNETLWYKTIGVPGIPIQRRTISCLFTYKQTPIRITSVHVDNVGGTTHRMKQVSFLMNKLNMLERPKNEIICGDFNTFDLLRTGSEKKLLHKKLGKEFIDASKAIPWTSDIYMIDFQTSMKLFPWFIKTFNIHIRRRLDYIWTKNLDVLSCDRENILGSDHYPIVAKLSIQNK